MRSITNEFTVQECDQMAPAKTYKLPLDDVLSGVRVAQLLVFWVVYCIICPFVLSHLTIALSVLRFAVLDYSFSIFNLVLLI